jgi:hypothetical protein
MTTSPEGRVLLCIGRESGTAEFVVRFRTIEFDFGHSRDHNLQFKKVFLCRNNNLTLANYWLSACTFSVRMGGSYISARRTAKADPRLRCDTCEGVRWQ